MPNPDNLSGRRLPRLLDIAGVAEHLAVSERHVRRLVAERRLDSSERDEDGTEAASASYPTRTDGGAYMPTRRRRTAGVSRPPPSRRVPLRPTCYRPAAKC